MKAGMVFGVIAACVAAAADEPPIRDGGGEEAAPPLPAAEPAPALPAPEPASPAEPPPAPPPKVPPTVRDVCRGVIDPYHPGVERMRFFRAAGVDNEIDDKEFIADAARNDPFARPFDRWKALLRFDANRNATIDWFEADAYRQDLRKRVLAAFDRNKDGRLTGEERRAANRAVAGGKLPRSDRPRTTTAPARRMELRRHLGRMVRSHDVDGDGRLNEEELAMMRQRRGERLQQDWEALKLMHFDGDDDGRLDEEEQAEFDRFTRRFRSVLDEVRHRFADRDGDGEVTRRERELAREEGWGAAIDLARGMRFIMDADADGRVSDLERADFHQRFKEGTHRALDSYVQQYDLDDSGRLSAEERAELLRGVRADLEQRIAEYDADADGRLSADESTGLWLDLVEELTAPEAQAPPREAGPATPETPR
jgi:hypothetical protein